jgi:hypothetical protein
MKKHIFSIKKGVWAVATAVCCTVTVISCNEKEFLDVNDPNKILVSEFPRRIEDLDMMLIDLYGRLRNGYWNSFNFPRMGILPDHTADLGYNGANFNEFAELRNLPSDEFVSTVWVSHYDNIARCNSFLQGLANIRSSALESQQTQLNEMEGQARFLRALNYFYLVGLFGETMITSEADRNRMGVPLWDELATELATASRERATVGQVWDFIIADLRRADELLANKTWGDDNKPRVGTWAVKSLLGKSYVFTRQWEAAHNVLREVIDQSGKKLVDYKTYSMMFNGMHEFNDESIFEVNFTPDRKDVWNNTLNTSTQYGIFISPSFLEDNGNEGTNGFGNLFIHDQNLDRFGFTDTTRVNQRRPDYIEKSVALRAARQVDPRMMVSTLQPWVDSIYVYDKWRKVTKNRGEGFPLTNNHAWCHRKYVVMDRGMWSGENESIGSNMYVLRLADVYLLYAEALAQTGNTSQALEYINKVHRRAYSQPVDSPSAFDYKSLVDKTMALGTGDHLANDPLKYERWAELFAEGHWWFDVARWKIGDREAAYYDRVKSGQLVWNDRKYAFPIPESEMLNNTRIRQNPGY